MKEAKVINMASGDFLNEGIPSKAIWDPSVGSNSSASSVASTASNNSDAAITGNDEEKLPSVNSNETDSRVNIYTDDNSTVDGIVDEGGEDDDNRLGNMIMHGIHSAHGPSFDSNNSKEAKKSKDEEKNDKIFGTDEDKRHHFIDSLSHLSEKQLRVRLWDSFRLARVILGNPVKDKRKLSHKSILHAIRKVAVMKIQIIRMSEEIDGLRQREKKLLRQIQKRNLNSPQHQDKENDENNQKISNDPGTEEKLVQTKQGLEDFLRSVGEDSSLSHSSVNEGPESVPSVRDVISDSDSPDENIKNLRQQAIKVLQEESDLALSQIREIDQRKRQQSDTKPLTTPRNKVLSPGSTPSLFLSPSSDQSEDDYSYSSYENASDILHVPRGSRSPRADRGAGEDSGVEEIRRVLQRVMALENEHQSDNEPEITTVKNASSSVSQVHQEVISLLTRLSLNAPARTTPSKEHNQERLAVLEEHPSQEGSFDAETKMPAQEIATEEQHPNTLTALDEESLAKISAAQKENAKSMDQLRDLNMQKEMLLDDIAIAKENTTQNREELQLDRLQEYKKQIKVLLRQEKERAKQIEMLDTELDKMAKVCVKIEDTESSFRAKHERHQTALSEFRTVTDRHTEKFRSLIGSINRAIRDQTTTVFGKDKKNSDDRSISSAGTKSISSIGTSGDEAPSQTIQRMECALTKQNIELFTVKAKLKAMELPVLV